MNKWILTIKNHSHEIDGDTNFKTLRGLERFIERNEGFLGSIAFGTKLDDGVFYKLMREGIISLVMIIDGVGEFSKK